MAGIKEECGVFGIYDLDGGNVVPSIYYGLTSLQHRGQESCGLAVSDTKGERGNVKFHKDLGLVSEVLRQDVVRKYEGDIGIGHVRYSTTGASVAEDQRCIWSGSYEPEKTDRSPRPIWTETIVSR